MSLISSIFRLTLRFRPEKAQAKVTFNVYRSRWRGIPLGYQRIAAGEVTMESLGNGICTLFSFSSLP